MFDLQPWVPLLALAVLGFMVWYAFLPLWMYMRVKGIERALWAVVSQLRAMRMERAPDLDPEATRRAVEVADSPEHVKLSMFGR